MSRSRLDQRLVDRGLAPSRSQAQRLILAGQVRVDGTRVDKPGAAVDLAATLDVETPPRFVSRGGDKLLAAIESSGIDPRGRIAMDVGASTGGFTDCLLQHGAAAVVAIDVGYGQLAWKLRQDPRVHVLERTNARYLVGDDLPADLSAAVDLVVVDVSFIGLAKILPAVTTTVADDAEALVLVKPQFEAGPRAVGEGGVVRDAATRRRTVTDVAAAALGQGWLVLGAVPSPLRGPAGNWECFLHLRRGLAPSRRARIDAEHDRPTHQGPERPEEPEWLKRLDVPDDAAGGLR